MRGINISINIEHEYQAAARVSPLKMRDWAGEERKRTNQQNPLRRPSRGLSWTFTEILMRPSRCYCTVFSLTLLRRKCPMIENLGSLPPLHSSVNLCQKLQFYSIILEKRFWSKKSALFWFRLILPEKSTTRWVRWRLTWRPLTLPHLVPLTLGRRAASEGCPASGGGVPRQEGQDGCFQHSQVVPGTVRLCCHWRLEVWKIFIKTKTDKALLYRGLDYQEKSPKLSPISLILNHF